MRRPRGWEPPPAYVEVGSCMGERVGNNTLRNTLLVHRRWAAPSTSVRARDVTVNCPVPRCVVSARVARARPRRGAAGPGPADLTVANVHLCGGRFDDARYGSLMDVRAVCGPRGPPAGRAARPWRPCCATPRRTWCWAI